LERIEFEIISKEVVVKVTGIHVLCKGEIEEKRADGTGLG
jgi:hypothetical protein